MSAPFRAAYEAAYRYAGGVEPIEAGIFGNLADGECPCDRGRLPTDKTPPCGCFPHLEVPVPLHRRDRSVATYAYVDPIDAERVLAGNWHLGSNGYACGRLPGDATRWMLHRLVMGVDDGAFDVDHRNHARLDCRRRNMRVVTRSANLANRKGAQSNSQSGIRGVTRNGRGWRATVVIARKQHYLGTFPTEEEAGRAAVAFRSQHMPTSEMDRQANLPAHRNYVPQSERVRRQALKAAELRAAGMPVKDIAKRLGLSWGRVYSLLKAAEIAREVLEPAHEAAA